VIFIYYFVFVFWNAVLSSGGLTDFESAPAIMWNAAVEGASAAKELVTERKLRV